MAVQKVKPGSASVKNPTKAKPVKKKSKRWIIVLLLLLVLAGGAVGGAIYMKWISVNTLMEMTGLREKPTTESQAAPQTNFPLVDLDPAKQSGAVSPDITSKPAIPIPSTNLPVKPPSGAGENPDTAKNYSRLAKLYGAMKPDEAVPILNQIEDEQVLAILLKMEDDQAAKILAAMEPKRAARLSQLLIKRK